MSLDVELVLQGASLVGQAVRFAVEVLWCEREPACWESARGGCPGYGRPGRGGRGGQRGRHSEPGCRYPLRGCDNLACDDLPCRDPACGQLGHDRRPHPVAGRSTGRVAKSPRHDRLRYPWFLRHCRYGRRTA